MHVVDEAEFTRLLNWYHGKQAKKLSEGIATVFEGESDLVATQVLFLLAMMSVSLCLETNVDIKSLVMMVESIHDGSQQAKEIIGEKNASIIH
jgi:hypothetical protein